MLVSKQGPRKVRICVEDVEFFSRFPTLHPLDKISVEDKRDGIVTVKLGDGDWDRITAEIHRLCDEENLDEGTWGQLKHFAGDDGDYRSCASRVWYAAKLKFEPENVKKQRYNINEAYDPKWWGGGSDLVLLEGHCLVSSDPDENDPDYLLCLAEARSHYKRQAEENGNEYDDLYEDNARQEARLNWIQLQAESWAEEHGCLVYHHSVYDREFCYEQMAKETGKKVVVMVNIDRL